MKLEAGKLGSCLDEIIPGSASLSDYLNSIYRFTHFTGKNRIFEKHLYKKTRVTDKYTFISLLLIIPNTRKGFDHTTGWKMSHGKITFI